MNIQKEYATPDMEIVFFEQGDVITGSTEGGEVTPWTLKNGF